MDGYLGRTGCHLRCGMDVSIVIGYMTGQVSSRDPMNNSPTGMAVQLTNASLWS